MDIKDTLRKDFIAKRKMLSKRRKHQAKQTLFEKLHLSHFQTILSYASMEDEVDTWELNHWICENRTLCIPKVEHHDLIPCRVTDMAHLHKKKRFFEPNENSKVVDLDAIDLVLVPGICFDENGYRLGFGYGIYDRFLKQIRCKTIGICFYELKAKHIPKEIHDVSVDGVLFV
ncbi:MAG: 5-formyltetrahydrofolate cyclo-ligase [Chlamydiae bacterium]|nr:5-formyltetrahydrofolate cyclo-ligase [Chlamydiota bacterium]